MKHSEADYEIGILREQKATHKLFEEFYELVKGEPMDEIRMAYVQEAVKEAEGV